MQALEIRVTRSIIHTGKVCSRTKIARRYVDQHIVFCQVRWEFRWDGKMTQVSGTNSLNSRLLKPLLSIECNAIVCGDERLELLITRIQSRPSITYSGYAI
jgi:hypothetical protein